MNFIIVKTSRLLGVFLLSGALMFALNPTLNAQTAGALDFDGSNDYVQISHSSSLNLTSGYLTLEAWVYATSTANQIFIHRWVPNQYSLEIFSNKATFVINNTLSGIEYVQSSTNFPINQWVHVAGVCDGASLKIYENGVLKGTLNVLSALPTTGSGGIRLGRRTDGTSGYLTGKIDEVRIWNAARSQTDIQNNMNSEISSPPASLVAYYKFSHGSPDANNAGVTILSDVSANSNYGTLNSFALTGCTSNWVCGAPALGSCTPGYCNPTWLGTTSTDWGTASNWSGGSVPGGSDEVTILNQANDPVVTGNYSTHNLEVKPGAALRINSGSLTVNGALTNQLNAVIYIADGASLVQGSTSSLYGAGTYRVTRTGSSGDAYNFWSTPINSANTNLLGGAYKFDPNQGTATAADDTSDPGWIVATGESMSVCRGYAANGAGTVTFNGIVNNGTLLYSVIKSTQSNPSLPGVSYNLLGNPYPSTVSGSAFLTANSSRLNGSLYFWDDDLSGGSGYASSDYAVWNGVSGSAGGGGHTPDGNIGVAQGFKVLATSNGNVTFSNSMRIGSNTQFFAQGDNGKAWISAKTANNHFNQILVGFMEDGTDGKDWFYDAPKMRGNLFLSLSSRLNDEDMAIQAFGPLTQNKIVPLGVVSGENTAMTLALDSVYNLDNAEVILEDAQLDVFHDLKESAYTFAASEAEYFDRFFLHFNVAQSTGLSTAENDRAHVYFNNGKVYLSTSSSGNANLEVYNTMGQIVYSRAKYINGLLSFNLHSLASGTYIVRVTTAKETLTEKIVIN